jgi:type I restriction enzyme S subunit
LTKKEQVKKERPCLSDEKLCLVEIDDIAYVTDYVANGSFASLKENVTYYNEPNFAHLLRVTDFVKGWKGNYKYVDQHAYDFLSKSSVQPGDLIIANVGEPGKLFMAPNSKVPMTLAPNSILVKPNHYILNKYFAYFFESPFGKNLIAEIVTGTAQQKFNKTSFRKLKIPLTTLINQNAIIAKIEELFSHIDAGVEGLKQAKAKLQQYRQSVLIGAVTGKLTEQWREQNAEKLEPANELLERILDGHRVNWEAEQLKIYEEKGKIPKDDKWKDKYKVPLTPETEDVPEIPSEWGYLRLEAVTAIQGGITVDAKRKPDDTTLLPYLRVANVQRGYLDLSKMKDIRVPNDKIDNLLLQDGDILFNEGGDRDKLGRGWVWRNEIDKCIYQNHVFRARLYSNELVPELVSIFGNTIGKEYFIKQGKQTTNLASINKTKLSAFPIPVCSFDEMKKIIEIVTDKVGKTDRTIIEVDKKILHASQLKSSILAKAFSGELVENIETDESAEQLLEKIQAEKLLLEEKTKLAKKKPTTRAKKMEKRPIIDVLKKSKKALSVDELFEQAGFLNDVSPEGIEAFYQELKTVAENENVTVTTVMLKEQKQGDKFEYKEVKENEAG